MDNGIRKDNDARKRGLPGSTIKLIAIATMLIDHIAAGILTRVLVVENGKQYGTGVTADPTGNPLFWVMFLMRMIGRLGFPIFCFLLVEGFMRTRSVKKYAIRLAIFALISEIPFNLVLCGSVTASGYQNVFFTLLIGLIALWFFDLFAKHRFTGAQKIVFYIGGVALISFYIAQFVVQITGADFLIVYPVVCGVATIVWMVATKKYGTERISRIAADLTVLLLCMMLADFLRTDYSGMGVLTIAVMYIFRANKKKSMLWGCIVLTAMSLSEITAFFGLIPISKYNGERGLKMKYFFYLFYPVHLFLIWLVAAAMGMGWISTVG